MTPDKVLYTDGHEVTVTESSFKVKKTMYQLKGIIHHDFLVIHPRRVPSLLIMLIGALIILVGTLDEVPGNFVPAFHFLSIEITDNVAAVVIGAGLLLLGTVILSFTKESYAIRLATAEGEKNVLVSKRKEYVAQVLEALNRACLGFLSQGKDVSRRKKARTFVAGSR